MEQKIIKSFYLLFLLLTTQIFAQNDNNSKIDLPELVFGEWTTVLDKNRFTEFTLHKHFIESYWQPYLYNDDFKKSENLYSFTATNDHDDTKEFKIKVISKDTLSVNRGEGFKTFFRQKTPRKSSYTTLKECPDFLKKTWYTTDGNNKLEFSLTDDEFIFDGKKYEVEQVVNYSGSRQYRFLVKDEIGYKMFYFKDWYADGYLQIGYNGNYGDLYKSNKAYPNSRTENVAAYLASIVPKEIQGNWLKTDGSNLWSHTLYYNFAVLDQVKWNYKSIKKKGNKYIVILEKNGTEKVMYVQPNTNNTVSFGFNKKQLQPYSLEKTNNPNFKLKENTSIVLDTTILKVGIATYTGIIKNFDKDNTERTGTVAVNNIFTGDQDSYIIEIEDDGSFSVSFPCYHLEQVYVKFPKSYSAVYVAPGKKTWHFINSSKRGDGFFAGDLKQLNTDVNSLFFMVFDEDYYNLTKNIKELTLKDYKTACFNIQKQQIHKLDSISKTRFLSTKAYQTMHDELTYRGYEEALSYDMYKRSSSKDGDDIDAEYISFITPNILNNKKAIETSSYNSFINRLKFLKPFREGISVTHPNVVELAKILNEEGVELTIDELALIEKHKTYNIENAQAIKKQKEFNDTHKDILRDISRKFGTLYQKMTDEERKKYFGENMSLDNFTDYIKSNKLDITFTEAEKEYQIKAQNLLTKEEKENLKLFYSEETNKQNRAFSEKYKSHIDKFVSSELKRKGIEKIRENLEDTFSTDVIIAQEILGTLSRNYTPLSDSEIQTSKKEIKNSFIANVLTIENDKLKTKIEANNSRTGYVVNTTSNIEANRIFEAITSKYKGKVIFVDFWATWCGPCRSGIKRMKQLKEDYKDKDVAFVYITSPSSPKTTYNNMIPSIKGEHYRVSKDEWNYLGDKFNISGIPHYLLVNKKGEVVKQNTSDLHSPESIKLLLDSYLEKE
ncbi:redoxin family protein [Wenyingzhuangia sp. chi5]|uniref:Redoxin family protein n=1 Tax=Wenyingzhuangia gilva TaxID=3057677 RepID=A0ABT8VTD3_9FLAO|nr:redoxin family protein [Wenyingzhuangia sp. chi5]MDO3695238.1 redoxin family protein [Wenyingzhuangia sp. chi5]